MGKEKIELIVGRTTIDKTKLAEAYKEGLENATLYSELNDLTKKILIYNVCKGGARTTEELKLLLEKSRNKAKEIYQQIFAIEKKYFDVKSNDNILNLNYKAFIDAHRTLKNSINNSKLEKQAEASA